MTLEAGIKPSSGPGEPPRGLDRDEMRARLAATLADVRAVLESPEGRADLLASWEGLAVMTGNHDLALAHAGEQPVVRFNLIGKDPYRALGIAMVHLNQARERYRLIARDPEVLGREALHAGAEREARLAYRILWLVHGELAENNNVRDRDDRRTMADLLRRLSWERHAELAADRQLAAASLGLPVPVSNGLDRMNI